MAFQLIKQSQPLFAPSGCMICRSAKFPILDLMQEFSAQQLRLYLCRVHAKEVAMAWGFTEGDEMDDLMRVRSTLTDKEHEHEALKERFEALRADMGKLIGIHQEQTADLERERQRGEQLQQQLEDVGRAVTATREATALPVAEEEPEYEPALD